MDKRYVKFNIKHAGFDRGQVVPCDNLEPGQRYWADHEDILGHQRICFFCDADGGVIEGKKDDTPDPGPMDPQGDNDSDHTDDGGSDAGADSHGPAKPSTEEIARQNQAQIDAAFAEDAGDTGATGEPPDDSADDGDGAGSKKIAGRKPRGRAAGVPTCKGVTARGTRCKRINNLSPNGYCPDHLAQDPDSTGGAEQ